MTGVTNTLRQHPVPCALLGLGAAWLIARAVSNRREHTRDEALDDDGRGGEPARQLASRAREYASGAGTSMRRMARRRQSQFQHMVQDSPLLVGCGALLLGVAFGLAVPETETENQWLGEARDTVVGRARDMAREATKQVQEAAGTLAEAAGKIAGESQS